MSTAPSLLKWIFATLAFVSGSVVAQLLQPVAAKTAGLEEGIFVARVDAAPAFETAPAALLDSSEPLAPALDQQSSAQLEFARLPSETPTAATIQAETASKPQPVPARPSVDPPQRVRQVEVVRLAPATPSAEPTPRQGATVRSDTVRSNTVKRDAIEQPQVVRSVVRTPAGSTHPDRGIAPQACQEKTLPITALPSLSVEDTAFRSIRRDLTGQFHPLGVTANPKPVSTVSAPALAKLDHTTTLPTEIVPAAKIETPPAAAEPRKTESPLRVARRKDRRGHVPSAVSTDSTKQVKAPLDSAALAVTVSKPSATPTESATRNTAGIKEATSQSSLPPTPTAETAPQETSTELSPELMALRRKVKRVLKMYREQEISVREKSAWSVMHSFIGYGVEKKVRIDHQGNRASAIGWVCFNNPCRGVRLFYLKNGQIYGRLGPGNQGHEGQFLAMLAQSRVRPDYPMKVEDHDFTVMDLVEREKLSCRPKTELTFKLIGLSHYLDINETWRDDRGEKWDIPRLMREEMRQPIIGAACGGTHRLFGLSYAVNRCAHKGKPTEGQFRRADIYVKDYQKYTFKVQNPDGSFSTKFFSGRGAANDIDRRLLTTGHISEWLAFSLDRERLTDPKMVRAIDYLSGLLLRGKQSGWKVGPLGHALHALNIYNDRVFKNAAKPRTLASHKSDKAS
ncbi:MAG: hypothetical protein P8K78_04845 [Pirellulales bacterium]|nr:hypothetical protein [Pirellulales bacterium]